MIIAMVYIIDYKMVKEYRYYNMTYSQPCIAYIYNLEELSNFGSNWKRSSRTYMDKKLTFPKHLSFDMKQRCNN